MVTKRKETKILEADVEDYLRRQVVKRGGRSYKFTSPNRRNVPDRLCVMPDGIIIFIECKRPGRTSTEAQRREQQRLIDLHQPVYEVDCFEEVDRVLGIWNAVRQDIDGKTDENH